MSTGSSVPVRVRVSSPEAWLDVRAHRPLAHHVPRPRQTQRNSTSPDLATEPRTACSSIVPSSIRRQLLAIDANSAQTARSRTHYISTFTVSIGQSKDHELSPTPIFCSECSACVSSLGEGGIGPLTGHGRDGACELGSFAEIRPSVRCTRHRVAQPLKMTSILSRN